MIQKKEIIVTSLKQRDISPKPGQTFKPFSVYQIEGNDGITYDAPNFKFYSEVKLGQNLSIDFEAVTTSKNGKVYTNYKIVIDEKKIEESNQFSEALNHLKEEIFSKVEAVETNILSAIKVMSNQRSDKKSDSPKY